MPRKKKYAHDEIPAATVRKVIAEQAMLGPGRDEWLEEQKHLHTDALKWAAKTHIDRNFSPLGWYETIIRGGINIRLKDAGGQGRVGIGALVPRAWQRKLSRELIEWRRTQSSRWMELVVKSRQLGFTTYWDAFIWTDGIANPGAGAAVAAHRDETLMALQRNFRIFAGQNKDQGLARRMSDKLFETPGGAYVRLVGAGDDLIRGDSPRHLHISEADYVDDLAEALKSAVPAIERTQYATVVLETTIQRNISTGFKDFVEQCRKGRTDYKIRFISWLDDDTATLPMTPDQERDFMASIESVDNPVREYEQMLRDRMKLSAGQIAFWRSVLRQDAAGDLQAAIEIMPTSLDEALEFTKGTEFFRPEAVEFYEKQIRAPLARYRVTHDALIELGDTDFAGALQLWVWDQPAYGRKYRIGADSADAEKRTAIEGSESHLVVIDEDTGAVVAEWWGYTSATEFAAVLVDVAVRYNRAEIVPEVGFSGDAVVDAIRKTFQYHNVYQREIFGQSGKPDVMIGVDGFSSRSNTRDILKDRVQEGFNERLFDIPSRYLLDQLINFGKRGGVKVRRRGDANVLPDDGVIALGLTCFGHQKMASRLWKPKAPYVPSRVAVVAPKERRGIKIEQEHTGPRFDRIWQCWRK